MWRCFLCVPVLLLASYSRTSVAWELSADPASEESTFGADWDDECLSLIQRSVAIVVAPSKRQTSSAGTLVDAIIDGGGFVEELVSSERVVATGAAGADREQRGATLLQGTFAEKVAKTPKLLNKTVWHKILSGGNGTTAADITGVATNKEGDLNAFLTSLVVDSVTIVGLICVFCFLRWEFPLVYSGNLKRAEADAEEKKEVVTFPPPLNSRWGPLSWIYGSLGTDINAIQDNIGLDSAMLIEFTHVAMKICATIGIPMCLIASPINYWFCGMPHREVDRLSRIGMANIQSGSGLYWVHACIVWLVVVSTEHFVQQAMDGFLVRRWQWLKRMPAPRCTTVLVENLPLEYCSDSRLRTFFAKMFTPEDIVATHVVRRTEGLLDLIARGHATDLLLKRAEAYRDRSPSSTAPKHWVLGEGYVDSVACHREQLEGLSAQIAEERVRIQQAALSDLPNPSVCAPSAFVTFRTRRDTEVALRVQYKSDAETFVMSVPPHPLDVRWEDLRQDATRETAKERIGRLCVVALYFGFVPIVVGISSVTSLQEWSKRSPAVKHFLEDWPTVATAMEGMLASLALTLFLSFLPTTLMFIFDKFFLLRADAWAQTKLQVWYFWFQLVFVVLVTTVGSSLIASAARIIEQPFEIFGLLADYMPSASHFYLNFMVLQWVTHSMNITRYMNLIKYLAMRPIVGARRAKELCEPEDQDYYGLGSRSARWTIMLTIALVFCTLSPLISILTLINFALCRLIYGYLVVYAEHQKPDLGGVFFVQQMKHLQTGLFIYVTLMIGMLARRGPNYGPAAIAVGALVYKVWVGQKFSVWFRWEQLPFEEIVVDDEGSAGKRPSRSSRYAQPELLEVEQPEEGGDTNPFAVVA